MESDRFSIDGTREGEVLITFHPSKLAMTQCEISTGDQAQWAAYFRTIVNSIYCDTNKKDDLLSYGCREKSTYRDDAIVREIYFSFVCQLWEGSSLPEPIPANCLSRQSRETAQ